MKTFITALFAIVAMAGQAQEARIDTIVPKFLINGYFFREMPRQSRVSRFTTPTSSRMALT